MAKYNIALYDIVKDMNDFTDLCEICDIEKAEKIFTAKDVKTGDTSFFSVCKGCGTALAIQYAHQNTYTQENLLFMQFVRDYELISNMDAELEKGIFGPNQESQ